jgi:RNA-directed DNA polymerase
LLLNVALHGLEEAAGVRHRTGSHAGELTGDSPALARYADDLVACCHSRQQAEQVKARLAGWLAPRGLAFNEDKTRIVHLTEGFDFLGFNVRRYRNGKLLIKPSAPAVRRLKRRLAAELRALRGSNVTAVLAKLVPITRGWAAYYHTVVLSTARLKSPLVAMRSPHLRDWISGWLGDHLLGLGLPSCETTRPR